VGSPSAMADEATTPVIAKTIPKVTVSRLRVISSS
jgi:hypothetical protein